MSTSLITQINIQVSFTSKNTTDPSTYIGTVSGIVNYQMALEYGDLSAYNAAVQRSDNTVGDPSTLHYFTITLNNGQTTPTDKVFANEWINPSSFAIISDTPVYTINVYDLPASGLPAILTVLQAAGFNASAVTDLSQVVVSSS